MRFQDTNIKRAFKNLFMGQQESLILLEPQMGLGDSLINLGLLKTLAQRYPTNRFFYATLPENFHTITWMLQDLNNIFPVVAHSGKEARQLSGFYRAQHQYIGGPDLTPLAFDRFYYEQHSVPFDLRWELAKTPAGPRAQFLYELLNPHNEPYILINRQQSGKISYNLQIDADPEIKRIEVFPATTNLFDWERLALNATAIHTIDTSFIHYAESLFAHHPAPTLYYHLARPTQTDFTRRQSWQMIDYGLGNPKQW